MKIEGAEDAFLALKPAWTPPANVRAAFTLRRGGASTGPYASLNLGDHVGDDPRAVAANRQQVQQALALPAQPAWLRQVHGVRLVAADQAGAEADASYTRAANQVCAVLVADCLPVLLCDDAGTVVAAAHAGWRGLAAGVLHHTVRELAVPPGQLMAWLGPAIGPQKFEVGAEVRAAFIAGDPHAGSHFRPAAAPDKFYADLCGLARAQLAAAGVTRISGGHWCTATDAASFFSHRRDGVSGRMAALIWRVEAREEIM